MSFTGDGVKAASIVFSAPSTKAKTAVDIGRAVSTSIVGTGADKLDPVAVSVAEAAMTTEDEDTTLARTVLPRAVSFSMIPTSLRPELQLGRLTNLVHQNAILKPFCKIRC